MCFSVHKVVEHGLAYCDPCRTLFDSLEERIRHDDFLHAELKYRHYFIQLKTVFRIRIGYQYLRIRIRIQIRILDECGSGSR
jgi:hypothetical protein